MGHAHGLSIEEQRKADISVGVKGFIILLIVTFGEVGIALVGNGHLISGFELPKMIMVPVMIGLSIYKAYYIVSIFMHLGHEVKGMAMTIVLPMFLLVWAIIAFLWEGDNWRNNRNYVNKKAKPAKVEKADDALGMKGAEELSNTVTLH